MASGKVPNSRDRERRGGCLINPRVALKVIFFPKLPPLFIFCASFFRTVTIQTGKGEEYILVFATARSFVTASRQTAQVPFFPFPFSKKRRALWETVLCTAPSFFVTASATPCLLERTGGPRANEAQVVVATPHPPWNTGILQLLFLKVGIFGKSDSVVFFFKSLPPSLSCLRL